MPRRWYSRPSIWGAAALVLCSAWAAAALLILKSEREAKPYIRDHAQPYVVGDLGGMPVRIPRYFAQLVEYDNDSRWGEPEKTAPPRTLRSTLRSFGFLVRFPDMAGESNDAMRADRKASSIYSTSWMRVGLNTGGDFPGPGALDRLAQSTLARPDPAVGPNALYEPTKEDPFGLTAFSLSGLDPRTGADNRQHRNARDIFVHRDELGHTLTYIVCSNRPHDAAPCQHWFSLEPGANAIVYVQYRRGMLSNWRDIQRSVGNLLMSFRHVPS